MSSDHDTLFGKANLDWDAHAPRSIFFDDIYFASDGPAETDHVFLKGNDLASRFTKARNFTIGELGFGTGLNFLAAWNLWQRTPKLEGAHLTFFSIEKFPLSSGDLDKATAAWPQFQPLAKDLIAALPPITAGFHHLPIAEDVTLILGYSDIVDALTNFSGTVDAWFLDGFAPSKNPEMWQDHIFLKMASHATQDTTFATFTVAGKVRRGLEAAGFAIERRPGFGRKREMLAGKKATAAKPDAHPFPWYSFNKTTKQNPGASIAIIGGGIAGTSLAQAVRKIGLTPTIIDPDGIAAGASGNPAGLIMPRLDLGDTAPAQFFKAAYLHTVGFLKEEDHAFFNQCGVTLKATNEDDKNRQSKIFESNLLPNDWITKNDLGLFFPQSGVIDPAAYCRSLAGETEVVLASCEKLSQNNGAIDIVFGDGLSRTFDAAIIANACAAKKLSPARTLPVSGIAGQLDFFPNMPGIPDAIAAGPYIAPAPKGGLIAGATYERIEPDQLPSTSREASLENIQAAKTLMPELDLTNEETKPRTGIRAQTPDRMPIVGPLPDWEAYGADYDGLRAGKQKIYAAARYQPNLWVLNGLGSRGLVTAPYCALLIASMIAGRPIPAPRPVLDAIHPGRFFIRALKRGTQ